MISKRKRSKQLEKMKEALSKVAKAVENDKEFAKEMKEWEVTLNDGLEEWEWK